MPKDLIHKLSQLKQSDEIWEGTVRLARMWITPKREAAYRPSIITFLDGNGKLLGTEILDKTPTTDQIWNTLTHMMRRPMLGAGWPRRPRMVYFDNLEQQQAMAPLLDAIGVRCEFRRNLPALEAALTEMEKMMNRREKPFPGLISILGITPPLLGHIYTSASEFFEMAPWRVLNDFHPIEIRYPADAPARYAVVMGSGGEVYGVSVQDTLAELKKMYAAPERHDLTDEMTWLVLFYEKAMTMSFDDLDAITQYGWPVTDELAYPVIGRAEPGAEIGLPTRQDLFWLAAALPACNLYIKQHLKLKRGKVLPAELTLTVPILGTPTKVYLRLPAL